MIERQAGLGAFDWRGKRDDRRCFCMDGKHVSVAKPEIPLYAPTTTTSGLPEYDDSALFEKSCWPASGGLSGSHLLKRENVRAPSTASSRKDRRYDARKKAKLRITPASCAPRSRWRRAVGRATNCGQGSGLFASLWNFLTASEDQHIPRHQEGRGNALRRRCRGIFLGGLQFVGRPLLSGGGRQFHDHLVRFHCTTPGRLGLLKYSSLHIRRNADSRLQDSFVFLAGARA